ncbi:MAG: hypothetical protein F6K55_09280 [Moorea sp. SIO4A3]|nr:hypothetical protein [Moorena sp. SIO4A3]
MALVSLTPLISCPPWKGWELGNLVMFLNTASQTASQVVLKSYEPIAASG